MSLSKSVQFGHLYRKLYNRNWRNSMRKGRIKSPCVSLECIKSSVTVFHRTNLQAGKQHILVTCYRYLYRNRFSPIDVVHGKFSICGSPFHFSHSFPRHWFQLALGRRWHNLQTSRISRRHKLQYFNHNPCSYRLTKTQSYHRSF